MEENMTYKEEIIATRIGNLGSSDAKIIDKADITGVVSEADKERLAILKGLYQKEDAVTSEMRYGDFIEQKIYEMLKSDDERWQSNPCYTSKKYARKNLGLIAHPDFVLINDETKTISVCECKATIASTEETKRNYLGQMYIEYSLMKEYAEINGFSKYKINVILYHYDSHEMYDADNVFVFNPDKITLAKISFRRPPFNIAHGMDVINDFLETFTSFHKEEVEFEYLPEQVQSVIKSVADVLKQQEENEAKIKKFKEDIYDIMCKEDIKSIKNQWFTLTRIDDTIVSKFNTLQFKNAHPTLYKKFLSDNKKKGYALIKVKKQKEINE